jgi:S-adenosylmethionine-diacylgycerolhomoserine-N-methlytransferase
MIPPWREALNQAFSVTEPSGGRLLVVDFGEQQQLPASFKRMLRAWLARFHVSPRAELPAALSAIAGAEGGSLTLCHLWRDYARLAELAR